MSVILILIAFSLLVAAGFLAAFIWSVRNGQYEDEYGSSVRILFDDDKPEEPKGETGEPEKAVEEMRTKIQ